MKKLVIFISILSLILVGAGCAQNTNQDQTEQQTTKKIELGYVQWASAEASTYLMQEVLDRAGYQAKISNLQPGAMYNGLAQGDIDSIVCAWLPKTHESYLEQYSDKLVDLGANFKNAKLGLVVPDYVDVDSIPELKEKAAKFNSEIIGVDPGAGIMQTTNEQTIPNYGLQDWRLVKSSGAAMTTELKSAIEKEEPIVVTGWTPHWKWSAFDLKFLADPKESYGQAEMIKSLGRKGIKKDLPQAAKILENFAVTTEQLGSITNSIQQGTKPEQAATQFVDNNLDVVNQWLPEGQKID
ncbi:glycine betaine ABC transporter substrate-binding protein [Halanaerobaculum tunisiense]